MRRKRQEFQFRGFVALADTLFAISAGLLLLNPIQFESKSAVTPPPTPEPEPRPEQVQPMVVEIQKLEKRIDRLEVDGRYLQKQAVEVLRSE